jgi:RNA polymerase sigma factor (sigma-70 family)
MGMSCFLAIAPDPRCLRQAAAGDREAQRQIYELTAAPVFALVRRLVHSRPAAEDVFQDCMIGLLDHLGDYRGDAPFGAWVRQVAARHCLMHLRSPWQRARRALWPAGAEESDGCLQVDGATGPLEPAHEAPLAERIDLERALARLPQTARTVVWLYDVEGLTHEEIAALFRRTISFSKSQLARAHALLRAELVDHRPPVRPVIAEGYAAQGQLP